MPGCSLTFLGYFVAKEGHAIFIPCPMAKVKRPGVISGLTLLIPLITGVITHLLSGMSHQVQNDFMPGHGRILIPSQCCDGKHQRTSFRCLFSPGVRGDKEKLRSVFEKIDEELGGIEPITGVSIRTYVHGYV